jgi:hypothetical protein
MARGALYPGSLIRSHPVLNPSRINWNNSLTRGLICCLYVSPQNGPMPPYDLVRGTMGTQSNTFPAPGGQNQFASTGFNGTSSSAIYPLDLSPFLQTTFTMRLFVDNNSASTVACEYSPNYGTTNGVIINPNTTDINCAMSSGPAGGQFYEFKSTILTPKVWYTLSFNVDRQIPSAHIQRLVINGQNRVRTGGANTASGTYNYGNSSFYFGARGAASAFMPGRASLFLVHKRCLSVNEMIDLQMNPYQIFLPPPSGMGLSLPNSFFAPWTTLGMEFP